MCHRPSFTKGGGGRGGWVGGGRCRTTHLSHIQVSTHILHNEISLLCRLQYNYPDLIFCAMTTLCLDGHSQHCKEGYGHREESVAICMRLLATVLNKICAFGWTQWFRGFPPAGSWAHVGFRLSFPSTIAPSPIAVKSQRICAILI